MGGQAAATSNSVQRLAQEDQESRAQVTVLHNKLEQLTNDSMIFSSLDQRIADLEAKDLVNEAGIESIRQQLQVLESIGS